MTKYRAGQRVHIEVEGLITEVLGPVIEVQVPGHGEMHFAPICCRVTVLAEPRPEEPTGVGAVVRATFKTDIIDLESVVWQRRSGTHAQMWETIDGRYYAAWDRLVNPEILHEGWKP